MSVQSSIETKLFQTFEPDYLSVINESHQHRSMLGSESHFKVIVVSELFMGQCLLARHRQVNTLLSDELADDVHALALHTYTPQEWQDQIAAPLSPSCRGGVNDES